MKRKTFSLKAFRAWLIERGAVVEPPTNPYEILRVQTAEGTFVAYENKLGKETWPEGLAAIREQFITGQMPALSPDLRGRVRLRHLIGALAERDGMECWFCSRGFLSLDSREITIEHLVPKAHGGPDHQSNLVLACAPCNRAAGNLPVVEKVKLREQRQAVPA